MARASKLVSVPLTALSVLLTQQLRAMRSRLNRAHATAYPDLVRLVLEGLRERTVEVIGEIQHSAALRSEFAGR